jgi:outer membrane protein
MLTILLLSVIASDTLNLTLDQAVNAALRGSPTSADARLDSADGRSKFLRGWSVALPSLSGSAGLGWSNSRSILDTMTRRTSRSWSFSLGASQTIFDASALGAVAQGYVGRELANLQSAGKINQLVWNVKTGYYGLQKSYGLLEIARAAVERASDNSRLAQVKQKLGKATGIEVLRAETNLHQARLDLMNAEKGLLLASEGFKAQLGITERVVVKPEAVDTSPPAPAFESFDAYWDAVAAANPGLQLARSGVKAAELGRKVAYGRMLPSLAFSISDRFGDSLLPGRSNPWGSQDALSYGFNLSLPILNVKEILLGINDAAVALERAKIAQRGSEITLHQTVTSAWLNYEQVARQVAYAAENLRLNQELYRQAQEQYRLGQLTQLDLLTVETGLSQARVSYLSALADVKTQQAQIDYLLGK